MGKLKILIVEDDKSTQQLFDKALVADIFDKQFCNNGVEALKAYQSWKPDIIILDIFMPLLTGYSVLKKIRREFEDRTTAIIMATSASNKEDVTGCVSLGIQGYIVKPFNYKEISNKVTEYYNIHKNEIAKEQ